MTRVVLDANVFVSAVLVADSNPGRVLDAWRRGDVDLVISPPILDEVRRVLRYPRLRRRHGWDDEQIEVFLERLHVAAWVTPGTTTVAAVPDDPTDDKYLACAIEGEADYVVTGDDHLLRLGTWQGIHVVTPAAFVRSELAESV